MIRVSNTVLCEHCFAQTGREPCPECGFGITYLVYDLKLECRVACETRKNLTSPVNRARISHNIKKNLEEE